MPHWLKCLLVGIVPTLAMVVPGIWALRWAWAQLLSWQVVRGYSTSEVVSMMLLATASLGCILIVGYVILEAYDEHKRHPPRDR